MKVHFIVIILRNFMFYKILTPLENTLLPCLSCEVTTCKLIIMNIIIQLYIQCLDI